MAPSVDLLSSFEEFEPIHTTHMYNRASLSAKYSRMQDSVTGRRIANLENIDWRVAFIGTLQDNVGPTVLGPTFKQVVKDMDTRLKDGNLVSSQSNMAVLNVSGHQFDKVKAKLLIEELLKSPVLVNWHLPHVVSNCQWSVSADVDSTFKIATNFEDCIGQETVNFLPRSNLDFIIRKKVCMYTYQYYAFTIFY
jgi:hypothetical protein